MKDNDRMVGRNFPPLNRISSRETRGVKHVDINKINGKSFLHKLNEELHNDLRNVLSFVELNITSLNKKIFKRYCRCHK